MRGFAYLIDALQRGDWDTYEQLRDKARTARDTSPRRPPRQPHNRGWGTCSWCADPVLGPDGEVNRRRCWHRHCLVVWQIASSQTAAREALWHRDHGTCAECHLTLAERPRIYRGRSTWGQDLLTGAILLDRKPVDLTWIFGYPHGQPKTTTVGTALTLLDDLDSPWFADHVTPLWKVDRAAPGAFRYWTLDNLQTLCGDCHTLKTAREARERADWKADARRSKLL